MNNLSKRSFEKEKDLPFKKDMYPCHGVAREFDELNKENKNILRLSKYGDSLLTKFITQNTKRENSLRQKEKDLWEYVEFQNGKERDKRGKLESGWDSE